jgi:predicted molibdopterin-dependent oxidoreductase YjgC
LAKKLEDRFEKQQSAGFDFSHPSNIWDEMAQLTPPFQGISYDRIDQENGVHWPCPSPDHPGTPYLFAETFPRGRGKFTPIQYGPSAELPDEEFPFILSTGRVLYHWHGGTMTRRSQLDDIYPEATVEINPKDANRLDLQEHETVIVRSRRGEIKVKALITDRSPRGTIFIPFHFAEAAANELTLDARDPLAKIPDYKVCAVALKKVD